MRTVIPIYPARLSHGRARGVDGISRKLRIEQYRRNIEAISGELISIIKLKMAKFGVRRLVMSLFKIHFNVKIGTNIFLPELSVNTCK
jgi:hypothetical protein